LTAFKKISNLIAETQSLRMGIQGIAFDADGAGALI
jgi:hypothetical protein